MSRGNGAPAMPCGERKSECIRFYFLTYFPSATSCNTWSMHTL
nr:MAG TPA: hypothetical protein [Inoviridae sp.]